MIKQDPKKCFEALKIDEINVFDFLRKSLFHFFMKISHSYLNLLLKSYKIKVYIEGI